MSTASSVTTYQFGFYLQHGGAETETAFFDFTSASGMDDTSALALAEAMKGVAWPTGTSASVTVERTEVTTVHYGGDLTVTPPAFT